MVPLAPSISLSPTFTCYSNTGVAGIAAKVVRELDSRQGEGIPNAKGDADFAFSTKHSVLHSPIPADEIFQNGKILPIYPVVDTSSTRGDAKAPRDLKKPFAEEKKAPVAESVAANRLEQLPEETYCVWKPKEATAAAEPEKRLMRKSFSLGNISRRWKLKTLLHRIQSSRSRGSFIGVSLNSYSEKKVNNAGDRWFWKAKSPPLL